MRLATWNVNSLKVRLPRVLQFLEEHRPAVVLLQETKTEGEAFPRVELAEVGYGAVDHSAGRWAGVAVLHRQELPVGEVRAGLDGEPDPTEARWLEVEVGGLRVVSVYVPNGRALGTETFEGKLRFLDAMAARAAALRGRSLLVGGDVNVCPTDLDVYDPAAFVGSTHVTDDERARLRRVLDDGGLVDAYRRLHPDEVGFTWWDYRQGHFHRKLGLRIDLAMLSADLAERLTACGIDRGYRKGSKPSDHAPLLVELAD